MAKWKSIVLKNQKKAVKAKKRKRELKKNSVSATMSRVKSLLFKGAKGKKNGNTGYVGRVAKGKYLYRTKKNK